MSTLLQELLARTPVILDGALGTQLQARGLEPGECPDAWNLAHPERVEEVARSYVEAGSDIILTNTLSANRLALARYGLGDKVKEINRAGAEIARRAAGGARVFASLGPSGNMLMTGEVAETDLRSAYWEQVHTLAESGVDGIVIETMTDLAEAKLAVAVARATGRVVVASMVFDSGKHKDRTMMGNTPEEAAEELASAGADVIGANCGLGIARYVPICQRLRAATDRPLWIKPNAGIPEMIQGRPVYRTTPQEFAGYAPALLEAGATFIGGCCGTTPEFIRALREKARQLTS